MNECILGMLEPPCNNNEISKSSAQLFNSTKEVNTHLDRAFATFKGVKIKVMKSSTLKDNIPGYYEVIQLDHDDSLEHLQNLKQTEGEGTVVMESLVHSVLDQKVKSTLFSDQG